MRLYSFTVDAVRLHAAAKVYDIKDTNQVLPAATRMYFLDNDRR